MAWRLVCESVNIPSHGSCLYLSRATYMAPSSALIMVCVSSSPDASMCVVVFVGEWMTEAPCLGLPSLCEPFVYVHFSGLCMGCQGIGWGGLSDVCVLVVFLGAGGVW